MKDWWCECLYVPYIVAHAGVAAWLDSLPKPARDELLHLLLLERTRRGEVVGAHVGRFAELHGFPASLPPHRSASNVLYLKKATS